MQYDEIKNILDLISDPADRLEFVMDLGRGLAPIPDGADAVEIKGCASRVLMYKTDDNQFYGWADSALVRGIVVVLLSLVNGKSSAEIRKINLGRKFADLNLQLGTGRLNGVSSMIEFLENA